MVLKNHSNKVEQTDELDENEMFSSKNIKKIIFNQLDVRFFDSEEEGLELLLRRIFLAQKSIYIVAGELQYFFGNSKVAEEIKETTRGKKIKVDVLIGPEKLPEDHTFAKLEKEGIIRIYHLRKRPIRHFIVVDSAFIGLENPHDQISENTYNQTSKDINRIDDENRPQSRSGYFFHSPDIGTKIVSKIEDLKFQLEQLVKEPLDGAK